MCQRACGRRRGPREAGSRVHDRQAADGLVGWGPAATDVAVAVADGRAQEDRQARGADAVDRGQAAVGGGDAVDFN